MLYIISMYCTWDPNIYGFKRSDHWGRRGCAPHLDSESHCGPWFSPLTSLSELCETHEDSVMQDCPSTPSSHGLLAKPCGNPTPPPLQSEKNRLQ